jgi:hypothetical protein
VTKSLYQLVYDGYSEGREGTWSYDLWPSNARMIIDFPSDKYDDDFIYVRIPNFHLINDQYTKNNSLGELGREINLKFSRLEVFQKLRDIKSLEEQKPFKGGEKSALYRGLYPAFTLQGKSKYLIRPDISNNLVIEIISEDPSNYWNNETTSLAKIMDDESVPQEAKKELAFNIDLFMEKNKELIEKKAKIVTTNPCSEISL